MPGYEAANWIGTWRRQVRRSNRREAEQEVSAALNSPELQKRFATLGAVPLRINPAQFLSAHGGRNRKVGPRRKAGKIKAQ